MSNIFKKILHHGFVESFEIFKQKIYLLIKHYQVNSGYYNFSNQTDIKKKIFNNIILFFNRLNFNKNIIFDQSPLLLTQRFSLLGKEYFFEKLINWHFNSKDPSKSYPVIFEKNIPIYDYEKYGDYRVTWELNRHHHFVWLAQDYFLSKDPKYLTSFFEQIEDWIDKNPAGVGINYVSSMEISIRLINWLTALIIVKGAENKESLNCKILSSMLGQSLYLNHNLTIYSTPFRNNHSIVELSGLIIVQYIFKWDRLLPLTELCNYLYKELRTQFYDDGINFEHSPAYTRFTIEALLVILIFLNKNDLPGLYEKIYLLTKKYVTSLRKFIKPDGSVPMFSDCDNGRILFLSGTRSSFKNFTGFFDFCGLFFQDDSLFISQTSRDFKVETKWWCFLAGIKIPEISVETNKEISFFPDSGYLLYNSPEIYVAFKSGYPGNKNLKKEYAPHAHNDLLSFELYWNSEPVLVDSGTYSYDISDNDYRNYFRSLKAHNIIAVNEKEQFSYTGNFGAKDFPQTGLEKENENTFKGTLMLKDGTEICRLITINNNSIYFKDKVISEVKNNIIKIILNFHPGIEIEQIQEDYFIKTSKDILKLIINDADQGYKVIKEEGLFSDSYNVRQNNTKLIMYNENAGENSILEWSISLHKTVNLRQSI